MESEIELLRLVKLAYGAATSAAGWTPFLEAYGRAMGAVMVTLLSWQRDSQASSLKLTAGPHACADITRDYNDYYAARNPCMLNAGPYMRTGGLTLSHVTYPVALLRKSEFYNDFLVRFDIGSGMGACLVETDGVCAHLSLQRSVRSELCGQREVQFLHLLVPHLQRAVQIHTALGDLRLDHRSEADALDRLSIGVVLVSADGRVRLANLHAARLLAEGDGLTATRAGVCAASAAKTKALRQLIAQAARAADGGTMHAGGVISLPRPSRRPPLSVLVAPTVPEFGYPRLPPGCATLIVRDPADTVEASLVLTVLYGLTRAEARLAELLLSGGTLAASAERLGIARETARTHLKSVLRKSGTNRQVDFVRTATASLAGYVRVQWPAA